MLEKIKSAARLLRARIPEELPRNKESMDAFIEDTLALYGLPTTPDYKGAMAKAIHGMSQASHRAPKSAFYEHLARFEVMRAAVVKVSELEKEKQAATRKEETRVGDQTSKGTTS